MKALTTIILILSFSLSLHAQKGKWKKTQKVNTIEAYESFTRDYPTSEFKHIASDSIIEKKFRATKYLNKIDSYQNFILKFPNCKYVKVANDSINRFAYNNAIKAGTIEEYRSFLKHFPNTKYNFEIEELLLQEEFNKVIEENTISGYKNYINYNRDAAFVTKAKNRLDSLYFNALDGAILKIDSKTINDSMDLRGSDVYYMLGASYPGTPPSKGYTYLITSMTLKTSLDITINYESDVQLMFDETNLTTYKPDASSLTIISGDNNVRVMDFSKNNVWWEGGEVSLWKGSEKQVTFLHIVPIDKISSLKLKIFNVDIQIPTPD